VLHRSHLRHIRDPIWPGWSPVQRTALCAECWPAPASPGCGITAGRTDFATALVRDRRDHAPWYTTKKRPSYQDMLVKLRRILIEAQYQPQAAQQPTRDEIRAVQLAWAQAAA
jgi:hypothetical protein